MIFPLNSAAIIFWRTTLRNLKKQVFRDKSQKRLVKKKPFSEFLGASIIFGHFQGMILMLMKPESGSFHMHGYRPKISLEIVNIELIQTQQRRTFFYLIMSIFSKLLLKLFVWSVLLLLIFCFNLKKKLKATINYASFSFRELPIHYSLIDIWFILKCDFRI